MAIITKTDDGQYIVSFDKAAETLNRFADGPSSLQNDLDMIGLCAELMRTTIALMQQCGYISESEEAELVAGINSLINKTIVEK